MSAAVFWEIGFVCVCVCVRFSAGNILSSRQKTDVSVNTHFLMQFLRLLQKHTFFFLHQGLLLYWALISKPKLQATLCCFYIFKNIPLHLIRYYLCYIYLCLWMLQSKKVLQIQTYSIWSNAWCKFDVGHFSLNAKTYSQRSSLFIWFIYIVSIYIIFLSVTTYMAESSIWTNTQLCAQLMLINKLNISASYRSEKTGVKKASDKIDLFRIALQFSTLVMSNLLRKHYSVCAPA